MTQIVKKGWGIFEDGEIAFGIFQGTRSDAEKMLQGFKNAPLNRKLNLTLHDVVIEIKEMN